MAGRIFGIGMFVRFSCVSSRANVYVWNQTLMLARLEWSPTCIYAHTLVLAVHACALVCHVST